MLREYHLSNFWESDLKITDHLGLCAEFFHQSAAKRHGIQAFNIFCRRLICALDWCQRLKKFKVFNIETILSLLFVYFQNHSKGGKTSTEVYFLLLLRNRLFSRLQSFPQAKPFVPLSSHL